MSKGARESQTKRARRRPLKVRRKKAAAKTKKPAQRSAILHTIASALLLTLVTSSLAAEVPKDLLGTWSTDSSCKLASPGEATTYTFTRKYISYYEIDCLIQDVKPRPGEVDFNLDCFKGGGFRYFDKLRVHPLSPDKLSLTFPDQSVPAGHPWPRSFPYIQFPAQGNSDLLYRCSHEVPEPERPSGVKVTKWTHNGSVVSFNEADNKTLEIDYETPRPGMLAVGAREGTMLFLGTRTEAQIEGKAYIFHHQCGPLGYEVHGEMLDGGNVALLTGLAPKVNSKCETIGKVADTLRFERMR
jgi:hypothetical protein